MDGNEKNAAKVDSVMRTRMAAKRKLGAANARDSEIPIYCKLGYPK